ncbi:Putative zinc-finger [Duganella sp. CF402]|uniref:zf-HC2 domain-containing protein n=1 Tax=unclassified Duganella TaxID=2636909 RepID=UPI0008C37678|nr:MULTISPECIES: zf-HC2 domain-containing protein [unclassified Duganella]RZT08390.1 putative zinc finger protein [Duganella sp. BK701]SEL95696.1 Putative zinc-finger [Duganella sp. CF402]
MSTNTTNISSGDSNAAHLALQDMLPWYASGALSEEEAAQVQQHLQACGACRAELGWQRKLLETEGPLPAGLDPERALARLMPQLDAAPAAAHAAPSASAPSMLDRLRAWLDGAGWQGCALVAQCAVIAVLAVQLLPRAPAPDYRALGNGATAMPDVLVVFKPDARLRDVQRLMQDHHAQIVGGPTVTGAYMLDVDAAHQPQLLSALRADPAVERAESLTAASQP